MKFLLCILLTGCAVCEHALDDRIKKAKKDRLSMHTKPARQLHTGEIKTLRDIKFRDCYVDTKTR